MKKILLILLISFIYIFGYGQTPSTTYIIPTISAMQSYFGKADRIYVVEDTADYVLCQSCTVDDSLVFAGAGGRKWLRLVKNLSNIGSIIPAGAIAAIPVIGTNPGTNLNSSDWIINTFYVSPPTASISGGAILPLQSSATLNYTLNYTSGRLSSTKPISTIVVAGINESFTQPSAPGSVSGTQAVSFAANTNITYSNVTTTTDGKSATASTSFTFLPERYYGFVTDTTGIGTTGYDDSQIRALSNELNTSKSKSWSTGSPTGVQFLVYAYYSTAGALTQFDMNGFPSIDAMNSVTRSFTNAEGYVGTWIIYWSKNGQTLSSTVVAN